ncbi:MAG: hypothetical protein MUC38_01035 [Cyclobacteriaceae bacterium]|nr:hypothetical protein [Cyclobacteriaceae bacterium]
MKKTFLLLFWTILTLEVARAQDYTFRVLATKGTSQVKTGGAWQPLKTGAKLQTNDELKLDANAYVALVHKSGTPLQLKEKDTYQVSALASKVGPGSSVVSKYTDFILSSNSDEARKNRMAATGAVTRGGDIKILLPKGKAAVYFDPAVFITWEAQPGVTHYVLIVKDLVDTELSRQEVAGNSVVLDLGKDTYAGTPVVMVEVHTQGSAKKSEPYAIKKVATAEYERVKTLLADLGGRATSEDALDQYIMAGFYEQNKLLIDAQKSYHHVLTQLPDVAEFREAYKDFLFRNKLN